MQRQGARSDCRRKSELKKIARIHAAAEAEQREAMLVKAKDILQNRERQGYRGRDVLLTLKSRERQGYRGCVPRDMLLRLKSRDYRGCVPVKSKDLLYSEDRQRNAYQSTF